MINMGERYYPSQSVFIILKDFRWQEAFEDGKKQKECLFQAIIMILGRLTFKLFIKTTMPIQDTVTVKQRT